MNLFHGIDFGSSILFDKLHKNAVYLLDVFIDSDYMAQMFLQRIFNDWLLVCHQTVTQTKARNWIFLSITTKRKKANRCLKRWLKRCWYILCSNINLHLGKMIPATPLTLTSRLHPLTSLHRQRVGSLEQKAQISSVGLHLSIPLVKSVCLSMYIIRVYTCIRVYVCIRV